MALPFLPARSAPAAAAGGDVSPLSRRAAESALNTGNLPALRVPDGPRSGFLRMPVSGRFHDARPRSCAAAANIAARRAARPASSFAAAPFRAFSPKTASILKHTELCERRSAPMPRGRKSIVDYAAQFRAIDEKIASRDRQIAALKAKRADLENRQQAAAVRELAAYLEAHGLTAGELLARLPAGAASVSGDKEQT